MGAFISMLCSKIGCQDKNMLTEEEPGEAKQYSWFVSNDAILKLCIEFNRMI